jgi:hypothetical protein
MFRASSAVAFPIILAGLAHLPVAAAPALIVGEPAGMFVTSPDDLHQAGMGPCHWAKVCLKWYGTNANHPYPHCKEWGQKRVCNPGSEMPHDNPRKIHVPPFQRGGPSFNRGLPMLRR